jgi:uridine kinase
VGICGGSSSGKSFITKWLKDKFTEINLSVTVLKEKNFLIPIEGEEERKSQEELLLSHDFDNYDAIDWPLFESTVKKLQNR